MSHLLFVTDHRFYRYEDRVFDNYVFDYNFFSEYLEVFDTVTVLCRIVELRESPDSGNLLKSSGENLQFVSLGNLSGIMWLLRSRTIIRKHLYRVQNADAIYLRIPSIACYQLVSHIEDKPIFFELIGDPAASLARTTYNRAKQIVVRQLESFFAKKTKQIIDKSITGSYVSNHLQKRYPPCTNKKTYALSDIRLNSGHFYPRENSPQFNLIKIIHIGSFLEVKNQKVLIDLVKLVKDAGYNIQLTLVGSGPTQAKCIKLARLYGVYEHIIFKGQVTGGFEIATLLSQHQFYIMPSFSEGMPRALIEAMACGLICLGSNIEGIRELLDEEYLFDPRSAQEIFHKLLYYYQRPERLKTIKSDNIQVANDFKNEILRQRRIDLLNSIKSEITLT